ncbi:DUF692 domain-containing protein [Taibaiella lutea]|uniref:DUF692 domain-containing protein n=1 Tax=Taibaiella lutea TaxID=2608001 RepID=A0A5M6CP40_9BACT|nr:DUF692 family multinuclear iron-containing protein [Taibaiella lutea]KAA5535015.1 DUF692 domain-containing protein [Taibaiella lutea]
MKTNIHAAIACNFDANILSAALPLFEQEKIEAIEWSFDALFKVKEIPGWFDELLLAFSKEQRLIGHGVFFSLFSGKWLPEQIAWLQHLQELCKQFQFDHITEHFGFMTGTDFHTGAPLGIPYTATTLAIGRDRLARIQEVCKCPVGLENLAFSYSLEEVKQHGHFLQELLNPVNGFIILDLHNLYCQLHNFNIPFEELIYLYPLELVREIHISGGSWESSAIFPEKQIRRDTHDDSVPEEVFELLEKALPLCPQLKYVVLEQLGIGLKPIESRDQFQKDFLKMESVITSFEKESIVKEFNSFLPGNPLPTGIPIEDEILYAQQLLLSDILENASNYNEALQRIQSSSLKQSAWNIESWQPDMLETAIRIAQKWKKGW